MTLCNGAEAAVFYTLTYSNCGSKIIFCRPAEKTLIYNINHKLKKKKRQSKTQTQTSTYSIFQSTQKAMKIPQVYNSKACMCLTTCSKDR